jgi:type I restriction enzyme S subunit
MNSETDEELDAAWAFVRDNWHNLSQQPEDVSGLRKSVLELAVRGKLVPQNSEDETAKTLHQIIKKLKEQALKEKKIQKDKDYSSIISDIFPWEIPTSWAWIRLQDGFEITRGGSPRPSGDPQFFGGNIPWITVFEITKDSTIYLTSTTDTLTELGSRRSRFVYPDDLLLTNSGATLGVPKISKIRGCINDGVAKLFSFHQCIYKEYAYYYLLQQTPIFRKVNQGMGQPNLNTSIIAGWFFPLPPLAEQKRIVAKVDELMKLCDQLEASLRQSQQRQRALPHPPSAT